MSGSSGVKFSVSDPDVREVPARKNDARPGLLAPKQEMAVGYYAKHMALLIKIFLFLDGCTHNGLTHLVNVYLVVLQGWTPFEASWIWFTRDAVKFFLQAYAGSLVDKSSGKSKKAMLAGIGIAKVLSGVIMVTTTAVAPQIIKGALDGAIVSFVLPATTALTLGTVGKTKFHRKHAQLNIMVKDLGVTLSVVILGAAAWAIYPNITNVFYQFIVVGILSLLCVLAMPGQDTVDNNVARGQSLRGGKDHWITRSMHPNRGSMLSRMASVLSVNDSDSESDDEEERDLVSEDKEEKKDEEAKEQEEMTNEEKVEEGASASEKTANESKVYVEYTDVLTLREMFAQPTRRASLIFLGLTFFSFHLANATVLPLLGQYIGIQEKLHNDTRSVLPSMAGLIVLKEGGSFFANWFIKSRLRKTLYSRILFIGCCALLLRLVFISVLVNYTDNLWALGSTNILEGVGIGCLDLALSLYSHLLSRQTGHFNFNMGLVSMSKTMGSALSIVLGGALATHEDYNVGFPVLTAMVAIPIFFSTRVHTPDLYDKVE